METDTIAPVTHHQPVGERRAAGKAARKRAPRSGNAELGALRDPDDAVRVVEEQNRTRLQFLVPVRRGRMSQSAFTFFRGSAAVMAADLADNPTAGLEVQLGGDAHLSNFGAYASPERRLVFDANDFDETLRGPFEWDVKRLATSFVIAARHNGLGPGAQRQVTLACLAAYRAAMAEFATMGVLRLQYDSADVDQIAREIGRIHGPAAKKQVRRFARRARSKDASQALRKLTLPEGDRYRIRSTPPLLFPFSDLRDHPEAGDLEGMVDSLFDGYRQSLPDHRRALLDRFVPIDSGLKVVGVGSVGTRCLIMLMEGRDRRDPFFLQFKEAGRSVLEPHLTPSRYSNGGRRVVEGQRLVQAVSDPFLGWTSPVRGVTYYVRQLKDWKGSIDVEGVSRSRLGQYARLCGFTLARGHARTGDPVALAGYLGKGSVFDRAVADYAVGYAHRNELYFTAFADAISSGELECSHGL